MFRWMFLAAVVANIALSAYYRSKARHRETISRSAEPAGLRRLRAALALPALLAIVGYVAWPPLLAWSLVSLPGWARWLGVLLAGLCLLLFAWIFRSIGANISETVLTKKSHELVTRGPYRWVRHPLYSVGILLFVALGLISTSWLFGAFGLASALLFPLAIIPREEAALIEKFGDQYERYRQTTGRLLPRLG